MIDPEARRARAFAPGRVELLGNYTDLTGGHVLSAAIELGVTVSGATAPGSALEVTSHKLKESATAPLDALVAPANRPWARYVFGVAAELAARGIALPGARLEIEADLPMGAGLASSAALEVATALCLLELAAATGALAPLELAELAQAAEHRHVGVRCGLMDQLSSIHGRDGHVILVDCAAGGVELLPLHADVRIVLLRSGAGRELAASAYNERRAELEQAARKLGVAGLGALSPAQFEARASELPVELQRRARHVVGEDSRVAAAAQALRRDDLAACGALLFASHESSRVDFENSTVELDCLVELARYAPGCLGARLTGAGFGGAIVCLVNASGLENFRNTMTREVRRHFGFAPGFLITRASGGARLLGTQSARE